MTAAHCAANDKSAPDCATPEGCSAPLPRLRVVLDGSPTQVMALLRAMARPVGGKRGPRLNAEIARELRRRLEAGEQEAVLARELGVSLMSISNIRAGRTYAEAAST